MCYKLPGDVLYPAERAHEQGVEMGFWTPVPPAESSHPALGHLRSESSSAAVQAET